MRNNRLATSRSRSGVAKAVINTLYWPAIHLSVAAAITRLPDRLFNPDSPLFRSRSWEHRGAWYRTAIGMRFWKKLAPDGAAWLPGGFAKKKLASLDASYLERFARETCRGEAAHWIMLLFSIFPCMWNPRWAAAVMVAYGAIANLPFIALQRHIRPSIQRVAMRARRVTRSQGE
jgi:glycosyl-4,4'-diaponeurosporenoate acyltransferase